MELIYDDNRGFMGFRVMAENHIQIKLMADVKTSPWCPYCATRLTIGNYLIASWERVSALWRRQHMGTLRN